MLHGGAAVCAASSVTAVAAAPWLLRCCGSAVRRASWRHAAQGIRSHAAARRLVTTLPRPHLRALDRRAVVAAGTGSVPHSMFCSVSSFTTSATQGSAEVDGSATAPDAASDHLASGSTSPVSTAAASPPQSQASWLDKLAPLSGNQITLRPYQVEAIEKSLEAIKNGVHAQAISLPTGAGKTVIFSHLIPLVPPPTTKATKTLVLAHRKELLKQAHDKIRASNPTLTVGIDSGTSHLAKTDDVDVVLASVPKLGRMEADIHLERFDPEEFKLIVIDEAHHATAETYQRVLDYFLKDADDPDEAGNSNDSNTDADDSARDDAAGARVHGDFPHDDTTTNGTSSTVASAPPSSAHPKPHVWGCSATLVRPDRVPLANVFEQITYQVSLPQMLEWGYVSPVTVLQVDVQEPPHMGNDVLVQPRSIGGGASSDLGQHTSAGNTRYHTLERTRSQDDDGNDDYDDDNDSINERDAENGSGGPESAISFSLVYEEWKRLAEGRKSTLVFVSKIVHLENIQNVFRENGVDARQLTGQTRLDLRDRILSDFRARKFPVLINVGVLTEGTDLPCVDCIVIARRVGSHTLLAQMVGRGLRLYPDKENCLILDCMKTFASLSLYLEPTLHPIRANRDGPALPNGEENGQDEVQDKEDNDKVEDAHEWEETQSLEHVNMVAQEVDPLWQVPESDLFKVAETYILPLYTKDEFLVLHPKEDKYIAAIIHLASHRWTVRQYLNPRDVRVNINASKPADILAVLHAHSFVDDDLKRMYYATKSMQKQPATTRQLSFIRNLYRDASMRFPDLDNYTKAQASRLITYGHVIRRRFPGPLRSGRLDWLLQPPYDL
ncbi:hypothetical protein PTSG_03652 [Salpingoeca rosetta]|uniref:Uncharacterized protein n=1 Tax=Salpingoeca rosetta (strain ATCC 50818 / BSB-021) TaxID=946362 RepID=F2U675_SALR5|nr:uncharacterized protein PTSG_03652 [Salpingoeca rosetta]EGD83016.1 hypothetical protein PTSG_03652 [Salpingoeca rosetta]|eukprot:XP_004995380.1 hypothetical protein PTSG_03652 [Salpingoeca rosetta]